jgi:hypothetical protein
MHVTGWILLVGSDVPAGRCVQDSLQREPLASLRFHLPPLTTPGNATLIDKLVNRVYMAFNKACKVTMKLVGMALGFNLCWWNEECREAAQAMRGGFWTDKAQREANKHLKTVVREAKRRWADKYITTANIWEVAAWRHGRRSSHILALCNHNNKLVYKHEELALLLSKCFFAEENKPIPTHFQDDPEPQPARPFILFTESELDKFLRLMANQSAPGSSGIRWSLLKKGWGAVKDYFLLIYNSCFILGHHPAQWREAKVMAFPKLDKLDYSLPKAHRPISLLETMGKLLEKAVARRMQYDIVKYELIQANQFGSRAHSSCLDMGLALLHDVQEAHYCNLKCGILLFDVRGFFNNMNHGRMTAILENLGYPPELVQWSEAFLRDRKVCLVFNNNISKERGQPIGVPQGSPLSPVYSITYTSSLLAKMRGWNNSSLGMYVDDSILFACTDKWGDVERLLQAWYTVCEEWL